MKGNGEPILNEIQEISPLIASLDKRNTYQVPKDYFIHLPKQILEEISVKKLVDTANVFTVPDNYFENLSGLVLSKIKSRENEVDNELREIAPLLNAVPKINPYSIPIRYFETFKLPGTENKKHIVVAISKATRKWITYAAAVIVGSVLITGVFYNYNHRNSDISKEMKKISDDELNSYVKEHSMTISYDSVVSTDDFNVQDGLKMISDDELQQYLNDNAETVSSATTSLKTTN